MKKHRGIKIALIALTVALLTALIGGWCMFGTQLTAANTIEKLDEGLWAMEYKGDYGFDGFLAQGGASSDADMADYIASYLSHGFWKPDTTVAGGNYGCSALATESPESGMLFGRNFDWSECKAMIVHTVPKYGYASVSTVCLDFLGFGEDWAPDGSMGDKFMALAAVYVPLDGMNEKGLCVADLMVNDGEVIHQDTHKPDLTTTSALRLLLDKAATVDEAVRLLEQYDMNFSLDSAHHFAISDASGKSVAVEWMGDEMFVTETNVVTNHYLVGDADPDLEYLEELSKEYQPSYIRYWSLYGRYLDANGKLTAEDVLEGMKVVASSTFDNFRDDGVTHRTQWTLVFDQTALTAELYRWEDWTKPYHLTVSGEAWLKK